MTEIKIGQVWQDTYLDQPAIGKRWLVKVMKLNEKSVRVEPCSGGGWYTPAGYEWQYRLERRHFESGRMGLVRDVQGERA